MPYFYDPNLDGEDHVNNNPSSVSISGAAPNVTTQGAQQAPNNNNQGLNTGSNFQNLDKYLETNNAQDFGQKFQGKVSDQITGAETQMSQASDQFKNQVQSANQLPSSDQVNQAIANPTAADAKQFQDWQKQSYSGPKNLAESQDAWNKYYSGVNQAQTNTKLLGTEPGRFTLLDQYFGRPSYNFGEKSLDNLLYQESGLGSQAKGLQDQATLLKTKGDVKAQELAGVASDRISEVDQNRKNVRAAIGLDDQGQVITGENAGAIGNAWRGVDTNVTEANKARQLAQSNVAGRLTANDLSPDQIAALGINSGEHLYDLNMGDYLTNGSDLTRDQVMSPEERSRIQALSQLAGVTDTFASGTAQDKTPDYTFSTDRFHNDQAKTQAAYENAIQNDPITLPSGMYGNGSSIPQTMSPKDLSDLADSIQRGLDEGRFQGPSIASNQAWLANVKNLLQTRKQNLDAQYRITNTLYDPTPQAAGRLNKPVGTYTRGN